MNNSKYDYNESDPTDDAVDYRTSTYTPSLMTDVSNTNAGSFSLKQYPQSPLSHNDGRPYRWFIRGDITERPGNDGNRAV